MQTNSFEGLSPFFLDRLKERNILCPTEIQQKVIPRLLAGESFIFSSATGTGKTFAYLLPLLERLMGLLGEGKTVGEEPDELLSADSARGGFGSSAPRGKPLLLIAAPTFELCSQIKNEADFLLKDAPVPVHAALLIGSAAQNRQIEVLKRERPEVIIGNPGRITALARQGKLKLRNIRFLVLDEGDRLVHDELYEETKAMVSLLVSSLRGISFLSTACSATLPARSRQRLLPLLGISAVETAVKSSAEVPGKDIEAGFFSGDSGLEVLREKVEHWAFFSHEREKVDLLRSLIAALDAAGRKGAKGKKTPVKALIFTSRARMVEEIASRLRHHKLSASSLSGSMDKSSRKRSLDAFRTGKVRLLVSSDLAARGLDISDITHVISLDVNEDPDVYLHRAGRTARAGKGGVMVSIGTEGEMRRLAALEKSLGLTVYPKELYGGRILAAGEDEQ